MNINLLKKNFVWKLIQALHEVFDPWCKRFMTVHAANVLRKHCFTVRNEPETETFFQSAGYDLIIHAGITCRRHVLFFFSLRDDIISGDVKLLSRLRLIKF